MIIDNNLKNYKYYIKCVEASMEYDWDELICMMHQIHAIHNGWADPVTVHVIYEEESETWVNYTSGTFTSSGEVLWK